MASAQQHNLSASQRDNIQAKTEELMNAAHVKTNEAKNKTADTAQSATESAKETKNQSAGFLQQKGEQMKNMAHDAFETMKDTLGVNDKK